jgi:uncharacterized protein
MIISLPKFKVENNIVIELTTRLPAFVNAPVILTCELNVDDNKGFYLLNMRVCGLIQITCQRCLEDFSYDYENNAQIAVCGTDERALELMADYECMVSNDFQVDLNDVLTDDMHLYCPERHLNELDCCEIVNQFSRSSIKDLDSE